MARDRTQFHHDYFSLHICTFHFKNRFYSSIIIIVDDVVWHCTETSRAESSLDSLYHFSVVVIWNGQFFHSEMIYALFDHENGVI